MLNHRRHETIILRSGLSTRETAGNTYIARFAIYGFWLSEGQGFSPAIKPLPENRLQPLREVPATCGSRTTTHTPQQRDTTRLHRILLDVDLVAQIVFPVPDAVVGKAFLPHIPDAF